MPEVDDLARQRAATLRFWREDASARPGGEWADLGGVQVHTTGLAPRHWNGASVVGPVDLAAAVPRITEWFAARDKEWGLLVPAELDLIPTGLSYLHDQRVMVLRLAGLQEAMLPETIGVRSDSGPADVALVQSEAFSAPYDLSLAFVTPTLRPDAAPPQETLTAYDGAEPVGCATVARMDGVAGVYGVAVRERWRRQGIGAALTSLCLRRARELDCDLAYLNPSEIGYGVYSALGFRDATPMRIWLPPE